MEIVCCVLCGRLGGQCWFTMLDIGSQKIKSQGIKENDYVTNLQYIKFFHILGFQLSYISFFFLFFFFFLPKAKKIILNNKK